jgi:hypothetical protein
LAIPAGSIDATDPGNPNACTGGKFRRSSIHDFADNLVSWNNALMERRQFAFHDMQIGAANATGAHAQQHSTRFDIRSRDLYDLKRPAGNILRYCENCRFHLDV